MAGRIQYQTLLTPEGENLSGTPWQVYPRPQMRRAHWINLNGEWDFAISEGETIPSDFSGKIIVPFPPESILSGVMQTPGKGEWLFYRKRISLEKPKGRMLLHFGAVDQIAEVCVNGKWFPAHEGGYAPFAFDITDCWAADTEIVVRVKDDLDRALPYGKQCRKRGGMWYTPTSGIWQTVWVEEVPEEYIRGIRITPGKNSVSIEVDSPVSEKSVCIHGTEGDIIRSWKGKKITIEIPNPHMWSPEDPYLYEMEIFAGEDRIESYFALRTLEIGEINGVPRLLLNGAPYFFHGLLDQGYFSDGIFLPAAPEGYTRDIEEAKKLGYNTLRKHIKWEPEHFYYECDRLGMIVFQDFINNGDYRFIRDTALPTIGMKRMPGIFAPRTRRTRENFLKTAREMMDGLYNHPCICYWTIFNEGWGQFDCDKVYRMVKHWDSTRFIDATSGWFYGRETDVESLHVYFRPFAMKKVGKRPAVLSEFGGYSCCIKDHAFCPDKVYGYRKYENCGEFENGILELYRNEIMPAVKQGLCGAILTQIADVEEETNGLLTYDRKACKAGYGMMSEIGEALQKAIKE